MSKGILFSIVFSLSFLALFPVIATAEPNHEQLLAYVERQQFEKGESSSNHIFISGLIERVDCAANQVTVYDNLSRREYTAEIVAYNGIRSADSEKLKSMCDNLALKPEDQVSVRGLVKDNSIQQAELRLERRK